MIEKMLGKSLAIVNRNADSYLDKRLMQFNINRLQAEVFIYIYKNEIKDQGVINKKFFLNKATVSKILNKLEGLNLISRDFDEFDARKKVIIPTNEGKALLPRLKPILDEWDELCYKLISDDEKIQLENILYKLAQSILSEKD